MSPSTSMVVRLIDVVSARPLDRLRAAYKTALARGQTVVAQDAPGVEYVPLTSGWRITSGGRINLLGAVCLTYSPFAPDPRPGEEAEPFGPDEGAAAALGSTWSWAQGAVDGFQGEPNHVYLMSTGSSAASYREGLRAGYCLYAETTVECPDCGARRPALPASGCDCGG